MIDDNSELLTAAKPDKALSKLCVTHSVIWDAEEVLWDFERNSQRAFTSLKEIARILFNVELVAMPDE